MSDASRHAGETVFPSNPAIRTVLSEFCESFEREMRPILDPVYRAADALAAAPEDISARKGLPAIRDLHHQMQALIGKVAEQQAYVLIFGPVKSGKSTFMNALSAAYVSEVTCLPAYPCMVYVSHSEEPGFVVTHYDGRTSTFTHRDALREIVADGHFQLTKRIREAENAGEAFDPAVQMPDAIRKVDIKIDIPDLAQSGAVLVDTPGLYTRMKFGYDRMTRDFRNAAACAIFIVKTDNLFLEQVFDEFGELLELFSRIFLVVNLDSSKKDLLPDGTLTPSLEHESPWEIIEAFENLSMTAPLKEAAEEGRLSIYPVDLLRAASRRIERRREQGTDNEVSEAPAAGEADFDLLLEDLTDYLDSNEYLKAFLDDSLRRARTLTAELGGTIDGEDTRALTEEVQRLRNESTAARTRVQTINRLRTVGWHDRVQGLVPWLLERVGRLSSHVKAETSEPIDAALDEWFESSDSLQTLIDNALLPIFASAHSKLTIDAEEALKLRVSEDVAGLTATEDLLADLAEVGIDMKVAATSALGGLKSGATVTSPRPQLSAEQIPVRRTPSDWLLLRSGTSLRRRLFGPFEQPDAELPAMTKSRRLGEPARDAMKASLTEQLDRMIDTIAAQLPEQLVRGFAECFEQDVLDRLRKVLDTANADLGQLETRLNETAQAAAALKDVSSEVARARAALESLIERFSRTEAAELTQRAAG